MSSVTGCRRGGIKAAPESIAKAPGDSHRSAKPTQGAESNNCDFICFEDVGWSDYWNAPFTVCIDDPSPQLKDCIGKHLEASAVADFGPRDTLLDIVRISPEDFREVQVPISDFLSKARGESREEGEYGTVRVTIFYKSKGESKDLWPSDYKLLLNQIPGELLQRNPGLKTGLQRMIKGLPLSKRNTNQ